MNEREAQEITRMVESGWSCDFGMQGRTLWCRMLYPFDAELATQAVVEMSKFPLPGGRYMPQVSDLRAILIALRNRQTQPKALPAEKRGLGTPEWVWVWSWARYRKDPPDDRGFPQQEGYANPDNIMTMQAYQELLAQWRKIGAPKSSHPLPPAVG